MYRKSKLVLCISFHEVGDIAKRKGFWNEMILSKLNEETDNI